MKSAVEDMADDDWNPMCVAEVGEQTTLHC